MDKLKRCKPLDFPVKALQFGSGNFLRAFVDWMLHRMNQNGTFQGSVRIIQSMSSRTGEMINAQDGLFHVIRRGVENGEKRDEMELIESVERCINAVSDREQMRQSALLPELRFVFSNTTEAGIEYRPDAHTFPAKVAEIVTVRCHAGLPGLIFIPCELIERNGEILKECTLKYITDPAVRNYVETKCIFCNTLVDRIVSGFPKGEAERYWAQAGVEDDLLTCCEPFFFFVIEAPEQVRKELPADACGLNVLFTDDLTPYRTRKVRFLNGAHTSTVLGAHMAGMTFVDEMVRDEVFGGILRTILFEEVLPTVALPDDEKRAYAESVLERFSNPFANHRLLSIALNSVSKWKVRVLPTILDYVKIKGELPEHLTLSMAYLIDFYRTCEIQDSPDAVAFFAAKPTVEAILGNISFWGMDLNTIPGFTRKVREGVKTEQ